MEMHTKIPSLNRFNIFAYPKEDGYMLYAPLSGIAAFVSENEMRHMETLACDDREDDTLNAFKDSDTEVFVTRNPYTITELTILLNQKCNFSCSYCYSADGREKTVLDDKLLRAALDFFVKADRGKELQIVFSGGGDPMLSFDKFRMAVEYAQRKALEQELVLQVGIVTNGSTLTDEHIEFIKKHEVELVVSFDILKDVQNAQRSHYDTVAATLDTLCDNDVCFGLRATVTPLNVARLEEMVEELNQRFPKIKSAAFEAVLSKELFDTPASLGLFYRTFESNIFRARQLGEKYGIIIGNTIINNLNSCKERACLGKLVLTPYGQLTACSRISSPHEKFYSSFLYGKVGEAGLEVEHVKYDSLMANNAHMWSECQSCIAKWHCSGGCLLARLSLPEDYFKEYCCFMKRMVVHVLDEEIKDA